MAHMEPQKEEEVHQVADQAMEIGWVNIKEEEAEKHLRKE